MPRFCFDPLRGTLSYATAQAKQAILQHFSQPPPIIIRDFASIKRGHLGNIDSIFLQKSIAHM